MALAQCLGCERKLLTEADPYIVVPHNTGYHIFCLECSNDELSERRMYDTLLRVINSKCGKATKESVHIGKTSTGSFD